MDATLTLSQEVLQKYANNRLLKIAEKMPNGRLWNSHNDGRPDTADGLAMLLDGTVVGLFQSLGCTLNEVKALDPDNFKEADGEIFQTVLSSWAHGGTLMWKGSWEESIRAYNTGIFSERLAIVGFITFERA